MHVRMEKTVTQRMLQKQFQNARSQNSTVMTRSINRIVVTQRNTICPAKRHHATGRQIPHYLRQSKTRIIACIGSKF